jgi:hypothetical protein
LVPSFGGSDYRACDAPDFSGSGRSTIPSPGSIAQRLGQISDGDALHASADDPAVQDIESAK